MIQRNSVLLIGVLFHLIYLRSIFDIYFISPVVSVQEQFTTAHHESYTNYTAPAERLFLIVGDGLRADKLFENPQLAPFLHRKALEDGRWGISHTRVPTESRPGHVALIAGLYEDVSAVTTGWQLNPVKFDSVFNQSRQTYSWGSPDILPMFREGATNKERIRCDMYDSHAEDFTGASEKLDTWVFDRVNAMLERAETNDTLAAELKAEKTVYFLHLLGLDTAGHGFRPYSREYLNNIAVVDQGIEALMTTLNRVWGPEEVAKTAFLFTADHGMSDWGSHGDGHPDNTRTPYITWGAGIRTPSQEVSTSLKLHDTHDERLGWKVEKQARIDVAQADLAVLMSHLIGVPFPKNNVGSLPVELLAESESDASIALYTNSKQIHAQYHAKAQHKAARLHFSKLIDFSFTKDFSSEIEAALMKKNWKEVQQLSHEWIIESIKGMRYLQQYDWLYLRTVITLGYTGWMLFVLLFVLESYVVTDKKEKRSYKHVFYGLAVLAAAYLLERSAPISYYAYTAFPLFFWYNIASNWTVLAGIDSKSLSRSAFGILALGVAIVQGIVFAYSDRRIISAMFPLASLTPFAYQLDRDLSLRWTAACCVMSIFTILPTVQIENIYTVVLGGCIMTGVGIANIIRGCNITAGAQTGLIALSTIVTYQSSQAIAQRTGLPLGCQITGWITLISSIILPIGHRFERKGPVHYHDRLMTLFLTFAPSFVILSISYEGLFYIAFWALLHTWIQVEREIKSEGITLADARRALFLFFLINAAFFGTGNIASVSSFSLDSVYRLIPIFSPFLMGILLLFKLMVPFAVLSATLGILNRVLELPKSALILILFSFVDLLTLNFFWRVKDEGSWLEIGSSISAFVIAGLLILFVIALERISDFIVGDVVQ